MALQLSEEQSSGISGDYWKVSRIDIVDDNICVCVIELYKDQAARGAGKSSITSKEYRLEGVTSNSEYTSVGDTPAKLIYEHLKTLPEFTGAVDV